MGFTSMDDLLAQISAGKTQRVEISKLITPASLAGYWSNLARYDGNPPASTFAGTSLTYYPTDATSAGAPYIGGAPGGNATKHIINASANIFAAAGAPWILMCCDQLGYIPLAEAAIENNTGEQTITMTPLDGAARYAAGVGCRALVSCYTAPTLGGNSISSFKYKNVAGDSHVAPQTLTQVAAPVAGQVTHSGNAAGRYAPFIPLAAGDTGISDIEAITFVAGTQYTGAGAFVIQLVRPLFTLPLPANGIMTERDFVNQLPSLPRIIDGAHIIFLLFQTGATTNASPVYITMDLAYGG